jgi:hypothetical protein
MQHARTETALAPSFYAWAAHQIQTRLLAMRPSHSTEQIAAAVAVTGNPAGA